jgi:hypothetical protein
MSRKERKVYWPQPELKINTVMNVNRSVKQTKSRFEEIPHLLDGFRMVIVTYTA